LQRSFGIFWNFFYSIVCEAGRTSQHGKGDVTILVKTSDGDKSGSFSNFYYRVSIYLYSMQVVFKVSDHFWTPSCFVFILF